MVASRHRAGAAAIPTGRPASLARRDDARAGRGTYSRPLAVASRRRRSRAWRHARLPQRRAGSGDSGPHRFCRGQGGGFRGLEGRSGVRLQGQGGHVPARSSAARIAQGPDAVHDRIWRDTIAGADSRDLQRNLRHVRKAVERAPGARRSALQEVSGQGLCARPPDAWRKPDRQRHHAGRSRARRRAASSAHAFARRIGRRSAGAGVQRTGGVRRAVRK